MFSPDLHEMYARERQRDFLHEAAADTLAQQASGPHPRQNASLVARLGRWMLRLRQGRTRPASSPYQARRASDAHAAGD
ncbi:MAG: hypothetical protein ACTHMU_15750 [Thermomicrobiales bacterium]